MRKSRPSMLPKPRRPGSTDRLSSEARRPSVSRSSSAEPARPTKVPLNGRSRSQQGERFGQSSMTPLRNSQFSLRPTTTPQRTPSEERASRSWQTSLDRALAFVTIKDQRPISNVAWQRSECARVQEVLAARGEGALIRPLTITRFVDITGALLQLLMRDSKLSNDNYVTKLPHLCKRLLYPGTVSKSWLKTVNTLHAFPHALALIAYLLDFLTHFEAPVLDDWMYLNKDDLSCLRRDYCYKCWIRFQEPDPQFEDLNEEYLLNLKQLLGNDEEKIMELKEIIKKSEACLEDEVEVEEILEEKRRSERRTALLNAFKAEKGHRRTCVSEAASQRARRHEVIDGMNTVDAEITRATAESQELKKELEEQSMSVAERTKLLVEFDYAVRVQDSKRTLAEQIDKMLLSKERELAQWQKNTLDSCVFYKQRLIHLSGHLPALSQYIVDEKELMEAACAECVVSCVSTLKSSHAELSARRADRVRATEQTHRKHDIMMEETKTKIAELKTTLHREQQNLNTQLSKEPTEANRWAQEEQELVSRIEELRGKQEAYAKAEAEIQFWEKQELGWRTKLSELNQYIKHQREELIRVLEIAREKRVKLVMDKIQLLNEKLRP